MSATKALKDMTPYEKLNDRKPDMKNVKVCGCVAYYHVPKEKQANKLEMRAKPALFLGMAESTLGYRLLDLETGEMLQRRSVTFREDVAVGGDYVERLIAKQYYGKATTVPDEIPFVLMAVTRVAIADVITESPSDLHAIEDAEKEEEKRPTVQPSSGKDDESDSSSEESDWEYLDAFESNGDGHGDDDDGHGGAAGAAGHTGNPATSSGRSAGGHPPVAGASGSTTTIAGTGGAGTASAAGGRTTRTSTATAGTSANTACMLIGVVNNILNPMSRQEALASEHAEGWSHAMDEEYAALMANGTWELVARPKKRKGRRKANILTSVWVLVAKRNEKGDVERLKARLAIRGFLQKYGLDYLATYSPVVRIESVRLVLLISMFLDFDCRHIDFVTAFLNGLYGLKQASKIWNDTLHKVLVELGFVQCTFDAGVYWRRRADRVVFLTVYVDDIILAGVPADIDEVVAQLAARFKLKDLGRVHHLLGMKVHYRPGRMLTLSQTAYIERLAEKFGLGSSRPVRSPQFHHEKITKIERDESKINNPELPYREIVGSLQYLVICTRPDLANAVRTLGRYTSAYTLENYRAAQRVVRYALATKNLGLVYRATPEFPVMDAFCDVDHQSCPDTSRSVTGYLLRLHGNA
ncbi:hypothetical protein PR003_g6652 [Phytophthora rubi]|uniref:Reverse transcriptase Ty1/copia-type domain-containing protein n=1 Tax=Phytophthora rubi TaxID=129364 RepID=A0A6A4FP84_9STRA|nr:hypothetical protein PR003_g6652 [Phytophthora rubi]